MSLAESHIGPFIGPRSMGRHWHFRAFAALTAGMAGGIAWAVAGAIPAWTPTSVAAMVLVTLSALWISGGAATAILGLLQPRVRAAAIPESWRPQGRTAVLLTLCGEPADKVATALADLRRGLDRLGLADSVTIFVLSDTRDAARIAAEEAALVELRASGAIRYRRRAVNTGRKPGNIADWLAADGTDFAYMLVLDADSKMSAPRVRSLIHRIEGQPRLGLLQAGMTLVPAQSRFGRYQRLSVRLLSPNFGRGMAAWSGDSGNYWGHNAIMRVAAFRDAADLPVLSGPAPFGGAPLSHDFVEAAWIRRAGWSVSLDPEMAGSAEDGPQTLAEFHKRDRRWCQGNLQHLRLLAEPGLAPLSRLHFASGIMGYLAAPIWLALVVMIASGAVTVQGALPFALIACVLLLPKLCAMGAAMARARRAARRRVILRAAVAEVVLSTLIAPLVMVRQTGAVASVLMGRDCGWKSGRASRALPLGLPEAGAGLVLIAVTLLTGPVSALVWLMPIAAPLLAAPILVPALDAGA
ncbi:glucans biosynthesis glucosyltransferase MdoH [Roseicyclus marinus]|uniref:glucans biosynthesis glucosyltransferase MdoH n=1 Tax=Roseicyclus marinus TaxID=2161673 RepID=UPI00240F03B0|nr:glucans biosynthesis glucosyltransferase MdoH [Roseicyclus marinus]MDG3040505.1 glucans biosynthesis glucosyltransferase MdoH [Roseicyclus marinus]